jgi:hypothetical protein
MGYEVERANIAISILVFFTVYMEFPIPVPDQAFLLLDVFLAQTMDFECLSGIFYMLMH